MWEEFDETLAHKGHSGRQGKLEKYENRLIHLCEIEMIIQSLSGQLIF